MKKFLAILLVSIMSLGVLGGTLVGIQSKGFRYWGWTDTLMSKLEKLKFWEKDEEKGIDKDTEIYNKMVNTPVAGSYDLNMGKLPVSDLSSSAWRSQKFLFVLDSYTYDNSKNVTDVAPYYYDLEKAKLTLDLNDTNLSVGANFWVTGKRSNELWGKFGIQFVDSNGKGFLFYVNALGTEGTAVENITGNKLSIVRIENYLYNWDSIFTPVIEFNGEEVNYFDMANPNNLKVIRQGADFTCYINNYALWTIRDSGIEEFEKISPSIVTMNVDLKGQNKIYDTVTNQWIYNLEKGVNYVVNGLDENTTYYTTQSLNGQAVNVYANKVTELLPNTNLETAEVKELTTTNFGENAYNYLASISSYYDKDLFDLENNIFTIEGDLEDNKGLFWQDANNDIYYVWRAPVEVDSETTTTINDYFTFIFTDINGNIGSFNFRYTI